MKPEQSRLEELRLAANAAFDVYLATPYAAPTTGAGGTPASIQAYDARVRFVHAHNSFVVATEAYLDASAEAPRGEKTLPLIYG